MDLLRSCYVGSMDFGDGSAEPYEVRWFFVDDTAPSFPFPHLYGSRNWDPEGPAKVGPGEPHTTVQRYFKGGPLPPIPPPGLPCGKDEWFLPPGVPPGTPGEALNTDGFPICCYGEGSPPNCVGWNITINPHRRSVTDLDTATVWIVSTTTTALIVTRDPSDLQNSLDFGEIVGTPCDVYRATLGTITITVGGTPHTFPLTRHSWDRTTGTSVWIVPDNPYGYVGHRIQLVSPLL